MTNYAAAAAATIQSAQLAFQVIYSLALTEWRYAPTCAITNGTTYDFIIIGGGTCGSILANRLSENSSYSVLLIEDGGLPPNESELPGMFPYLVNSTFDYNMTALKDNRTMLKMKDEAMTLTAGKMLGGTGGTDHMMYFQGCKCDYDNWAKTLSDNSWKYTNMKPYMKKAETLTDPELLNSEYASQHGTNGPIKLARQRDPANNDIMAAYGELGYSIVPDFSAEHCTVGIAEPLYAIHNNVRQSSANAYLNREVSRPNLCVALYTTGIKVLIEDNVAVGVQAVDSDGNAYTLYANKDVILSAGAINTPKLLMLSGVGPKEHLEKHNITVVADLPVGKNFQDQISTALLYNLGNDTTSIPLFNPSKFPTPVVVLIGTSNKSLDCPDYEAVFLRFPKSSSSLVSVCTQVIKYNDEICNKFYESTIDSSSVLVVLGVVKPESRGYVELASADYKDNPVVDPKFYTDSDDYDITTMVNSLKDVHKITTSSYFQGVNGSLVNLDLCSNCTTDDEYWENYAKLMGFGMWHYAGTAALGVVLDSDFKVKNISNLRVVDASSMITEGTGKPRGILTAMSEKASCVIKSDHGIVGTSDCY